MTQISIEGSPIEKSNFKCSFEKHFMSRSLLRNVSFSGSNTLQFNNDKVYEVMKG